MSIKANELRIGNCFRDQYSDTEVFKVWGIDRERIWYGNEYSCVFEEARPIPLTPELLEKCGFEWETDKHKHLQKETLEGCLLTFYYCEGSLESIQFYTVDSPEYYDHPATNLKFLHQLQNLYFSLTGEELQINL